MALSEKQLAVLDGLRESELVSIWDDLFAPREEQHLGMEPVSFTLAMRTEFMDVLPEDLKAYIEAKRLVAEWIRIRNLTIQELLDRERQTRGQ